MRQVLSRLVGSILQSLTEGSRIHACRPAQIRDRACDSQPPIHGARAHAAAVHRLRDEVPRVRIQRGVFAKRGIREHRIQPPTRRLTLTCREHAFAHDCARLSE